MTMRLAALFVTVCLCPGELLGQAPPTLSRQQRELLQAVLTAVDTAPTQPQIDATWQTHVLRASDGSHYVAFSIVPAPAALLPAGPALLYIRLATAPGPTASPLVERSAVREFLAGERLDPRLLPRRNIAIGDMPAFGPSGTIGVRGSTATTGSNEMKLMALERERAKKEQEERDKQRRAELEGKTAALRELFPFEDFDFASQSSRGGARVVERALTAGPGEYILYAAWADPAAPKPAATIRVVRHPISLPTATAAGLALSTVIVADAVSPREVPYPPSEQAAHPYAIGPTEIAPARDSVFTRDERLNVAFQVINARPSETGKPDVAISLRVVRVTGDREAPVAPLNPLAYNESTLPSDFDLRLGHPLFAAVSAPLATLARGDYRLKIAASDRISGAVATADTDFHIVGTPLSLLAEAPPLAPPFRRETAFAGPALAGLVRALTPAAPSPALRRALDVAAEGKFIDLLIVETVPPPEEGTRTALTGLALYTIGDASAVVQLQRGLSLGAPAAPVHYLIGAARATQARDPDAIASWEQSLEAGMPAEQVAPLLVDAYLRRGDGARAAALVTKTLGGRPPAGAWARTLAAAHIAAGRDRDAVTVLDDHLARQPDDAEARWLLLRALYGSLVRGEPRGDRERFIKAGEAYIAANGPQAALAAEWLRIIKNSE